MPKRDLDLERKWRIKFDEYKESGKSIKGWCKENGIVPTTFRYWIKRFESSEEFPPAKSQFAKITL
jgi:transposase-like protein